MVRSREGKLGEKNTEDLKGKFMDLQIQFNGFAVSAYRVPMHSPYWRWPVLFQKFSW
jgi:hypothetical protein